MPQAHTAPKRRAVLLTTTLLGLAFGAAACGSEQPPPRPVAVTAAPTTPPAPEEIRAFLSGYSFADNNPANSSQISNPTLHATAGGTGTYVDPITVGVGHAVSGTRSVLDWPAGTRFYVPNLRRYLIVEDTCGDGERPQDGPCHSGYPADASTWLNVWVGGDGTDDEGPRACMAQLEGVWVVIVHPEPGYVVDPGPIYRAGGCTAQYGDTLVLA